MSIRFVLLPLFVEVLLTFAVMFGMMYFRTSTLRNGETRFEDIALREPKWPVRATIRMPINLSFRSCFMS